MFRMQYQFTESQWLGLDVVNNARVIQSLLYVHDAGSGKLLLGVRNSVHPFLCMKSF